MMTTHCLIESKPDCSVRPAKKAVNQLASSGLFELIRAELWLQTHSKVPLNSFKALFVPAERESRQAFAAKWRHITQQTMCSAANSLAEWMRESECEWTRTMWHARRATGAEDVAGAVASVRLSARYVLWLWLLLLAPGACWLPLGAWHLRCWRLALALTLAVACSRTTTTTNANK